jgi:hypothetical protein
MNHTLPGSQPFLDNSSRLYTAQVSTCGQRWFYDIINKAFVRVILFPHLAKEFPRLSRRQSDKVFFLARSGRVLADGKFRKLEDYICDVMEQILHEENHKSALNGCQIDHLR